MKSVCTKYLHCGKENNWMAQNEFEKIMSNKILNKILK